MSNSMGAVANSIGAMAINLAVQTVLELEKKGECYTRDNQRYGKMKGHFSDKEYYFFKNGREVYRNSNRKNVIEFLALTYFNLKHLPKELKDQIQ